jgi:hypothetical protein
MIGAGPGVCVDVQRLSSTGRVGPPQIDKAAVVVATLTKPPESLGVMHIVCDNYGTTSTQGARQRGQLLHSDGSVAIALARGGGFGPTEPAEPRVLSTLELDQAALNVFTLAQQAARDLRIPGDFEVRLSVEPAESRFRHPADDRQISNWLMTLTTSSDVVLTTGAPI